MALFDAPVADRRLGALKNAMHPTRDIKSTALDLSIGEAVTVPAKRWGSRPAAVPPGLRGTAMSHFP